MLEPETELPWVTAGGERMNLWLSGLLDQSFTLLRTAGQLPAPADGWGGKSGQAQDGCWHPMTASPAQARSTSPDPGSSWCAAPARAWS
jgi:hypothetical protein